MLEVQATFGSCYKGTRQVGSAARLTDEFWKLCKTYITHKANIQELYILNVPCKMVLYFTYRPLSGFLVLRDHNFEKKKKRKRTNNNIFFYFTTGQRSEARGQMEMAHFSVVLHPVCWWHWRAHMKHKLSRSPTQPHILSTRRSDSCVLSSRPAIDCYWLTSWSLTGWNLFSALRSCSSSSQVSFSV